MTSCYICKRSRNRFSRSKNITFHRFPCNLAIRHKWYDFIIKNGLKLDNITRNSVLCSRHFHDSMFVIRRKSRHLDKNAVPIISVSRMVNAKLMYPEVYTIGQSSICILENLSHVLVLNSPEEQLPTDEVGCKQLLKLAEQLLLQKKPNIVVAGNDMCEGVSVLEENSPVKLPTNEIGCEQLLISAEQLLQKKPNIVVAGNDMCEGVSVLEENSPVKLPTNEIGCEQLLISAEQLLQKKPNIVVAGNDMCEGVSVLEENSPVKLPTNEIGCEQLLISAEQLLQKKPNIVVAGNDMCEGVSVLEENSPVKLPTNEIGCEQLLISAEQLLQKKPNIVVAGNDMCEGVSVLEENSPVKVDCITLNVLGPGNTMFHFTTKKHILLAKIMNVYCKESGLAFNTVKFNFDGRTINEIDTPTSLDLVDGDTIEVFQWQNGSGYF